MASSNWSAEIFGDGIPLEATFGYAFPGAQMFWAGMATFQMTAIVTATGVPVVWQAFGIPDTATNWSGACTTQTGYTLAQLTAGSIRWTAQQYRAV